jgi:branched-chain amino acid aminotransferase
MQQALFAGAAWMNGAIIPIFEASISVTDWGLTHSDITYDVAPPAYPIFSKLI